MEKVTIKVEGMRCGECEIAVQDAVRRLPGVKKAKARRRRKEMDVEYDPSLSTSGDLVRAVNATGYRAAL